MMDVEMYEIWYTRYKVTLWEVYIHETKYIS